MEPNFISPPGPQACLVFSLTVAPNVFLILAVCESWLTPAGKPTVSICSKLHGLFPHLGTLKSALMEVYTTEIDDCCKLVLFLRETETVLKTFY